jgi:hypothetical protein
MMRVLKAIGAMLLCVALVVLIAYAIFAVPDGTNYRGTASGGAMAGWFSKNTNGHDQNGVEYDDKIMPAPPPICSNCQ